jgi:hypothetical protein
MKQAPENGKESSHSAHANGMNEWILTGFFFLICGAPRSWRLRQKLNLPSG